MSKISRKTCLLLFFALAMAMFFMLAFYAQKTWLPQQLHQAKINLNLPARYAFIADTQSPKLAVYDTYDGRVIETIDLAVPAQLLSISRIGGYLAYARYQGNQLFFWDLATHTTEVLESQRPILSLAAHSGGRWVTYSTSQETIVYDKQNDTKQALATQDQTTLTYSADGRWLFVAETSRGMISVVNLATQQQVKTLTINQPISPVSVSPVNQRIFFSGTDALFQYDLNQDTLTEIAISADNYRPYLSNDGQALWLVNRQGDLLAFSPNTLTKRHRYSGLYENTSDNVEASSHLFIGWLNQVAVLNHGQSLISVDLDKAKAVEINAVDIDATNTPIQSVSLDGEIADALVMSDSKTYLATMPSTQSLIQFDLRSQTLKSVVSLPLKSPGNIVMGETNTLCH